MKLKTRELARLYVEMAEGKNEQEVEKLAATFVQFLSGRHELARWREMIRSIDDVWKEKHGVANVTITCAHPLSKSALQALEKAAVGATVNQQLDPRLIGGARVRIDDRVVDLSVAGHLAALKAHLVG